MLKKCRLLLVLVAAGAATQSFGAPIRFPADSQGFIGSKACAVCHSKLSEQYGLTPMAQASGWASSLRLPGGDVIAARGSATYSTVWQDGSPQLRYKRQLPDGMVVQGSKNLSYYIGSGTHGRGFIFLEQGQPFQSPIAYYGVTRGWDLAPGYEAEHGLFLSRKVETGCLNCHASGISSNPANLFREGAVSCERCHGPGENHVAAVQSSNANGHDVGNIVNPSKLAPESRDSICAQCHLTGEARVLKPGKTDATFRPGDRLSQHVVPFVWATPDKAELKVIGHFEGLWQSRCKQSSGDKISCLTCHDPHANVPEASKAAYYKGKCLGCHAEAACKAPLTIRMAKADSCVACHMQTRASTDGQHTAFTDHSIRKNDQGWTLAGQQSSRSRELTAFWPASATDRDYALAYADESWLRQDDASMMQAHQKLLAVWTQTPGDPDVAAQLAYTWDLMGVPDKAEALYREALKADPENLIALTNMGTHLARSGDVRGAAGLWRKALTINPGLPAPGLNLVRAEEALGRGRTALDLIRQVLSLNPDLEPALKLERDLTPPR